MLLQNEVQLKTGYFTIDINLLSYMVDQHH